jgi:peptide/nickel transport system permease protein
MRTNDVIFAFPSLLMAVMITAAWGVGVINAVIAIGIFNIPVFARVTRGAAQSLWTRDYILAARVAGKGPLLISLQHVLPNLGGLLVVQAAIQFAMAVVAEAGLSYVGLGVQPPVPSWGRMLAEAQTMIGFAPWLAVFPGLAIMLLVLGFGLAGDGLNDRLDPRFRRERRS